MAGRLILKLLIFGIVLLGICYMSLYINPNYEKEYVAAITLKTKKLKETTANKIVIIGGSNASFGIDSELLEEKLGIPVVNMALHGGLPLKFIIEQVKEEVKSGDILLLSKEYSGFTNGYWNKMNGVELPKIITYDVSQLRTAMSDRKLFETSVSGVFKTLKHYVKSHPIPKKNKGSVYSLDAFQYDNLKEEFLVGNFDKKVEKHALPKIREEMDFISELKGYQDYFKSKDVAFYLTPPVIINGYYKSEEIMPFLERLSKTTGIPLLNHDKNYIYKRKYFFNSHYHPNASGRERRTMSLLEDIQKKFGIVPPEETSKIFVADHGQLNLAKLDMLNKVLNFKVNRTSNELFISSTQDAKNNYFRIQFKAKNLNGYYFYLKVTCAPEILEKLRFRGIGNAGQFDTIKRIGEDQYELWIQAKDVYYSDKNSYLGITLLKDKVMKDDQLSIQDVGVFKEINQKNLVVDGYVFDKKEEFRYLKIESEAKTVSMGEVIQNADNQTQLFSNKQYLLKHDDNKFQLINFYDNRVLYETESPLRITKSTQGVVKIFK